MTVWVFWLLAGVSWASLLIIWFVLASRKLMWAKRSVESAIRQVRLHVDGCAQVRQGPYEAAAANSLSVSRLIYREAVKNYEAVRCKPVNRLPAFLLGYGALPKTDGS